MLYHYAYTSAERDSIILAWKEKVFRDGFRPISLVGLLGDNKVSYWASSMPHNARDWVPYIRQMPHDEYPSGSACICRVVLEVVDEFTSKIYDDESIATKLHFPEGSSNVEPGISPASDATLNFTDMEKLRALCGSSGMTGRMHFSHSVPDAYELCGGVGEAA